MLDGDRSKILLEGGRGRCPVVVPSSTQSSSSPIPQARRPASALARCNNRSSRLIKSDAGATHGRRCKTVRAAIEEGPPYVVELEDGEDDVGDDE